jgi:hypothetical protein
MTVTPAMSAADLWWFLPGGYALTVALELPVLWLGLSRRHPPGRRLAAAFWLTACTYPVVVLVLPPLLWPLGPRWLYLLVAESFAAGAEAALFRLAFAADPAEPSTDRRDTVAVIAANLASFAVGEGLWVSGILNG